MPSKLRKAIDAVKDQTSISIAKVSSATSVAALEVTILKATTREAVPLDDRYVNEILSIISTDRAYAAACAQSIAKRISKTRKWIVALKSLNLVLRIFQDGDPFFPREVLHAMKRGAKILNLSNFRDDSNSSDYTAFVRTFALYLDERLDCYLTGKLQKRFTNRRQNEPIPDMNPATLIDRVSYWQKLLDRVIAIRPAGAAKSNRLVQVSLHAIVQESFDLYRDISDGLALLLDSFFHLQYQSCLNAFQACVKASNQFVELSSFYDLCKSIGIGRTSEYPSVQQPSDELIETLQEFLKDQASFPTHNRSPPSLLHARTGKEPISTSKQIEDFEASESSDRYSDRGSDLNSQCASVGDLMSGAESWASPSVSIELDGDGYSDNQSEKQSQIGDFISANDSDSCYSLSTTHGSNLALNLAAFDDFPQPEIGKPNQEETEFEIPNSRYGDWEHVLAVTASKSTQESEKWPSVFEAAIADEELFQKTSAPPQRYNPFLEQADDIFAIAPTFKAEFAETNDTFHAQKYIATNTAEPTFRAQAACSSANDLSSGETASEFSFVTAVKMAEEDDPFAVPWSRRIAKDKTSNGCMNEESILQQQKQWMENQSKIIAKRCS